MRGGEKFIALRGCNVNGEYVVSVKGPLRSLGVAVK